MKAIARALGVARSNLLEQRGKRRKAPDAALEAKPVEGADASETAKNALLLARIRRAGRERPSYG